MEFLEVLLQALFLGFSGFGIPITIISYCILSAIKNSGKTGGILFSAHLTAQVIAISLFTIAGNTLIESFIVQTILNLICFSICILSGLKLAVSVLKNEKFLNPLTNEKNSIESDFEYEDIYSHSADAKKYKSAKKLTNKPKTVTNKALNFFVAFVLTITNTNWFLSFSISIKSLVIKSYLKCSTSIGGLSAALLFIIAFLLAQLVFYLLVSKIAAFIGRILNELSLRILISMASLVFFSYALFIMFTIIKTASVILPAN